MMVLRLLPLLSVVLVCGCLEAQVGSLRLPADSPGGERSALTEAQRTDWKAFCKRMKAEGRDGLRLAVLKKTGHWQVRCLFVEFESRKTQYIWEFGPGTGGDEKSLRKDAAQLALRAEYRCTALLDLFGAEEPRFVVWYHDSGGALKEQAEPPTAEIAASAWQYLLELQRRARDMR
jgi:hypothetical protein